MEPVLPTPINKQNNAGSTDALSVQPLGPVEGLPTLDLNSQSPSAAPLASPPANDAGQLQTPSSATLPKQSGSPQAVVDDPQIADDVDVIEKEWIDKAKRIVSATKADPHQQEKEVSKLQADYLLKRYNKQVKLSE